MTLISKTRDTLAALIIVMVQAMLSGCATPVITLTPPTATAPVLTAPPAPTATNTLLSALSPTVPRPTVTQLLPPPIFGPDPTATTFYTLTVDPSQVTIPAGGALIIEGAPANWRGSSGTSRPNWKVAGVVDGLPPGARAQLLHSAMPFVQQFGITTSCLTPPGTYTLTLHTTGPGVSQSAHTQLTVGPPLPDSAMGTYITAKKIDIRYGGPSSMASAIIAPVTLCDTIPPRRLRITVQSALSQAWTPMLRLPKVRLFRALSPSAEGEIAYGPSQNVLIVQQADLDQVEWHLSGGPYIIDFGEHYWGTYDYSNDRDAKLVGRVTYALEIVH